MHHRLFRAIQGSEREHTMKVANYTVYRQKASVAIKLLSVSIMLLVVFVGLCMLLRQPQLSRF